MNMKQFLSKRLVIIFMFVVLWSGLANIYAVVPPKNPGLMYNDRWAIGVEFAGGVGLLLPIGGSVVGYPGGNVLFNLHIPKIPIIWNIGLNFLNTSFGGGIGVSLSGDGWWLKVYMANFLAFYMGFGIEGMFWVGTGQFGGAMGFGGAARLPIGFSFMPFDWLEPFVQIIPRGGVIFSLNAKQLQLKPAFDVALSMGIRFWL